MKILNFRWQNVTILLLKMTQVNLLSHAVEISRERFKRGNGNLTSAHVNLLNLTDLDATSHALLPSETIPLQLTFSVSCSLCHRISWGMPLSLWMDLLWGIGPWSWGFEWFFGRKVIKKVLWVMQGYQKDFE